MESTPSASVRQRPWFLLYVLLLTVLFRGTLGELVRVVQADELYSYMLLVPLISIYLIGNDRGRSRPEHPGRWMMGAALAIVAALAWIASRCPSLSGVDVVAFGVFAFITCLLAGFALLFGTALFERFAFALLFLYFLVPMPAAMENGVTVFFQHWSGLAADALLRLTGTPVFRQGMVLHLPGLLIEVAEECSGIRASLVLFMTSLLASHLFLTLPSRKAILVACIVPIGILRNALRITTICLLTIHVDPNVIRGPLHRQGGTPFFILSLVPVFIILWLLRRSERHKGQAPGEPA